MKVVDLYGVDYARLATHANCVRSRSAMSVIGTRSATLVIPMLAQSA